MYSLKWSPRAQKDMGQLYAYYVQKSVTAAAKIFNGIIDDAEILKTNPQIAPVEQSLSNKVKTYRSLVVSKGRYKVIYFAENKIIYIARVWNCRQNPKKLRP